MANIKELKLRLESIAETRKITNAMYLISSTKLNRAKSEFEKTKPYFESLKREIKRIFRIKSDIDSKYFYPVDEKLSGTYAYLIITSDKGLAGSYNQNVIKEATRMLNEHKDAKLFVMGEYGRHYFLSHHIPVEKNFRYTAQNPTLTRAREIAFTLLEYFKQNDFEKIYVIYTDFENGVPKAKNVRILPFHRADFLTHEGEKEVSRPFEFRPSIEDVLESIIPSYVTGFIYSALVDSFCCEQNARMIAMESANRNSDEMLEDIKHQYNYTRQKVITQEITEIAAGAKYQKSMKKREDGKNGK
jgi:F-type H+-transporting ATPase subunit gamma